jgi:hypothetical protein
MHELRGIDKMPHDFFTTTLVLSGICAVCLALLVWHLKRRHTRKPGARLPVPRAKPARHKRKRHRS